MKALKSVLIPIMVFCSCTTISNAEDIGAKQGKGYNKTFFVTEIFQKYGNKDYMTYEGFEHLLENLGIGQLEFDISHDVSLHKINGTFKEFHDELKLHKHNHNVDKKSTTGLNSVNTYHSVEKRNVGEIERSDNAHREICLTPQDILATYGFEATHGVVISRKGFLDMCPAIVYELDQKMCRREVTRVKKAEQPEYHLVWIYATLSIFIMSVSGLLCIFLVPTVAKSSYNSFLAFLVAMGVGTLCGDALLHLLPHVLSHKIEGESKIVPILRGTIALLSMFLLFAIEVLLKFIHHKKILQSERGGESGRMITVAKTEHSHLSDPKNHAVASMVIIGDILHNVTDGLSIGAAFTSSIPSGIAASIAIFSHELPHELGDYATLINSGMSKRRTLFYNVISSIFSFFGMIIGVLLGEIQHASSWINAFTAGSFFYIALSDLVPEMKSFIERQGKLKNIIQQIFGLLSGGLIMFVVAIFEDDLETWLK